MLFNKNCIDNDLILFDTNFVAPLLTAGFESTTNTRDVYEYNRYEGLIMDYDDIEKLQHKDGTWKFVKIAPNDHYLKIIK